MTGVMIQGVNKLRGDTKMINVHEVSKTYRNGTEANKNISFLVDKGDVLGIIGANGAGKTTLVKQITGLLKPTSGSITVNGISLTSNRMKYVENISFFNQRSYVLDAHKANEVVTYAGIYRGLNRSDAIRESQYLLDYFSLTKDSNRKMSQLSGGQVKLVLLCSALIASRPVIILDEPTNDVDPLNRNKLWSLLYDFNKKKSTTIVVVTHNTSELEAIARSVAIMHDYKLVECSDIQTIKNKYGNSYRLSIKSDHASFENVIKLIPFSFNRINNNEIVIDVEKNDLENFVAQIMPVISENNLELKVYRCTLADVYQRLQEGHHV